MFNLHKIQIQQATNHQLSDTLLPRQKVQAIAISKTPMGIEFVLDEKYYGLLYYNMIPPYVKIETGQSLELYIRLVRHDNKIDLLFLPSKKENDFFMDKILTVLKNSPDQTLEIKKKGSPERIFEIFSISKRKYKTALQTLISFEEVSYENDLIKLLNP